MYTCLLPCRLPVTADSDVVIMDAELCETLVEAVDDVGVTSRRCLSQFGDGHCDRECDNEETQFDGFDCVNPTAGGGDGRGDGGEAVLECGDVSRQAKPASRRSQCSRVYADGTCEDDCDSAACLWDGGDCIGTALR